jgi:hypothetical protein
MCAMVLARIRACITAMNGAVNARPEAASWCLSSFITASATGTLTGRMLSSDASV